MPEARRDGRVPLLERRDLAPEQRARIGRAVSALLGVGLAAIAAIGALAIWHLVRRGRLIRERLGPPKAPPPIEVPPRDPPPSA